MPWCEFGGQPDWRTRQPDGKLPVPPYAPAGYKSDMPNWDGTLKDADIWAVLAYIKSRWPEETRKIQAEINRDSLQ